MANTTFTTWADLHAAMLNKLASHDFTKTSATIAGNVVTWENFSEFQNRLSYVETRMAMESGAISLRVYAKDGGRG